MNLTERWQEFFVKLRKLQVRYQGCKELAAILTVLLVVLLVALATILPDFKAHFDSKATPSC